MSVAPANDAAAGGAGGADASSSTDTKDATLVQDAPAEEVAREAGVEARPSYPTCATGTKQVNWCGGCQLVPPGGGQVMAGIQTRDGYRCNAAIIGTDTATIGTQDKCIFDDATFGVIMAVKSCDDCKGCAPAP